jgi:hypothetical protein
MQRAERLAVDLDVDAITVLFEADLSVDRECHEQEQAGE